MSSWLTEEAEIYRRGVIYHDFLAQLPQIYIGVFSGGLQYFVGIAILMCYGGIANKIALARVRTAQAKAPKAPNTKSDFCRTKGCSLIKGWSFFNLTLIRAFTGVN
jgi:hypothetical protein